MSFSTKKSPEIELIVYDQNTSPRYLRLSRRTLKLVLILLPSITLIALFLATLSLWNLSPSKVLSTISTSSKMTSLQHEISKLEDENSKLQDEIENYKVQASSAQNESNKEEGPFPENKSGSSIPQAVVHYQGLGQLALFRPVSGQKDATNGSIIKIEGVKVINTRETTNLQFNIINTTGDVKFQGHIIVLMKQVPGLFVYPEHALGPDFKVNFSSGEPFATQRFRPVDAPFPRIRKPMSSQFSIYIFSKNGDLAFFQNLSFNLRP